MRPSFKNYWRERVQANLRDTRTLAEAPLFEKWEASFLPHSKADTQLVSGLKLRFGDGDTQLAGAFFDRCRQVLDRMDEENKYASLAMFPYNRGYAVRTRVIVESIVNNAAADAATLDTAGNDIDTYIRKDRGDAAVYSSYLDVAELLLLSGEKTVSERMLKRARSWRVMAERVGLLRDLLKGADKNDPEFLTRFERYFDRLRAPKHDLPYDPDWSTVVIWGALYDHLVSGNHPLSWERAIAAASA